MTARYQWAGELAADLRGLLAGNYGKSDAAIELKKLRAAAGEVMVDESLKRPRRGQDITTA